MNLKIKNAINYFNDNREPEEVRLTQTTLGIIIMPEMNPKTAGWYVSRWCEGKELGKLKPGHIIGICEKCKVDPNFLFNWNHEKK